MRYILTLTIFIFLLSCKPQPKSIDYHLDECAFCKMKISDPQFGAELVTKKGKVYKYDSAECLLNEYIQHGAEEYAYVLVTDYTQPNSLIDAKSATYLVSNNLPSPMGGNLSCYENNQTAKEIQQEKGGQIFSFEEIHQHYIDLKE